MQLGIDEDVAALFAGAFAQIPQKVIWKLNGKPSATLTPNVKVVDWIPQNDLLGKLPGVSTLVLVGTCRWEFECGPIQIPIFEEKLTHSYTNRPDFGPNFDQKYRFFSNFLKFE